MWVFLVERDGRQYAMLLWGAAALPTLCLACSLLRDTPEQMGLHPDSEDDRGQQGGEGRTATELVEVEITAGQALHMPILWVMLGAASASACLWRSPYDNNLSDTCLTAT